MWRRIGPRFSPSAPAASHWPRHRLNAGADDLRDIAGGIGHQTEQQREVFRADRRAALEIEARSAGTSHWNGAPENAPDEPAAAPSSKRQRDRPDGGPSPVASCCKRARRFHSQVPTAPQTNAAERHGMRALPVQRRQLQSAVGQERDAARPRPRCAAPAGLAEACTRTAVAAAAAGRGSFRRRTRSTLAISQFFDSRPIPISVPRIVARTIPTTDTFRVFSTPMTSARP